jgi:hypothetical protein
LGRALARDSARELSLTAVAPAQALLLEDWFRLKLVMISMRLDGCDDNLALPMRVS